MCGIFWPQQLGAVQFVWLVFCFWEIEPRRAGFYFWIGQGRCAAAKRATSRRWSPDSPAQPNS